MYKRPVPRSLEPTGSTAGKRPRRVKAPRPFLPERESDKREETNMKKQIKIISVVALIVAVLLLLLFAFVFLLLYFTPLV